MDIDQFSHSWKDLQGTNRARSYLPVIHTSLIFLFDRDTLEDHGENGGVGHGKEARNGAF